MQLLNHVNRPLQTVFLFLLSVQPRKRHSAALVESGCTIDTDERRLPPAFWTVLGEDGGMCHETFSTQVERNNGCVGDYPDACLSSNLKKASNCVQSTTKGPRKRGNIVAETLLRKHCFLAAQTGKHLLKKQNVSEKSQKHFLFLGSKKCFRNNVSLFAGALIGRISLECRKTKTKVITLTNHNRRKQSNEPIRARSKYM